MTDPMRARRRLAEIMSALDHAAAILLRDSACAEKHAGGPSALPPVGHGGCTALSGAVLSAREIAREVDAYFEGALPAQRSEPAGSAGGSSIARRVHGDPGE